MAHLAILALRSGDLVNADREATRALAIAHRNDLAGVVPALPAFAVGALVAAERVGAGRPHAQPRSPTT